MPTHHNHHHHPDSPGKDGPNGRPRVSALRITSGAQRPLLLTFLPSFCQSLWKAGCANLEKTLDRQDTALCGRCPDYETARTNLKSLEQDEERRVTLLLRRMEPALNNLRNFTLVLSRGVSTAAINTNILWGLLDLFTEVRDLDPIFRYGEVY